MSIEKAALAEAIKQLDPANDAHWTDDGSPMLSEVQRLCNDSSVTRAQVNDAIPGYDRKIASFRSGSGVGGQKAPAKDEGAGLGEPEAAPTAQPAELSPTDDQLSIEKTREILKRRVATAEENLAAAKVAAAEATREVGQAEMRLDRAIRDLQRKFPPISPEEAIKQHLARQHQLAIERAQATGHSSQIDQSMAQSRRPGWSRPQRSVA